MKSASILPLAIMLAATSMFGQSLTEPMRLEGSKCPIGLEVNNGRFIAYKNSSPADGLHQSSPQRFDFKMKNLLSRDIVAAQITARAFSNKLRFFSVPAATPDVWQTIDVAFDVRGNDSVTRELSFAHFPPVRTFEVNSVTYADGSTWHASSRGACSVAPRGPIRISAQ
jgi:hypothetical protein